MADTMRVLLLVLGTTVCGCTAPVGSQIRVPPDAATTCAAHCESIGLALSAVAIMANNVGCVCQARGPGQVSVRSATTAGMATILMQEQARQEQERRALAARQAAAH